MQGIQFVLEMVLEEKPCVWRQLKELWEHFGV